MSANAAGSDFPTHFQHWKGPGQQNQRLALREADVSKLFVRAMAVAWALLWVVGLAQAAPAPEDELVAQVKMLLKKNGGADWQNIEKLPKTKWAALPPTMLQNCLPDGGCFARQGVGEIAGRKVVLIATGARTIVSHIYFRNAGAAFGEAAVLGALRSAGIGAELVRCPVPGSAGDTNWYRLKGAAIDIGILSVQSSCGGNPCEGFSVSFGADLPALQPNQLKMYSEQCTAGASARKPVSTALPHELLAQTLEQLLPPAAGGGSQDWAALPKLSPDAKWNPPYKVPGPKTQSGQLKVAGREFSLLATGTQTQVTTITFDEIGLHGRGEDLLGVLRAKGLDVQLARCGPVYTESTNNWYSVKNVRTKPVMLRQSLRMDGKQIQDAYELRLDASLPKREARDRDPGVNGCK